MRKTVPERLEAGRVRQGASASLPEDGFYGAFTVHGPCGAMLRIIAAGGEEDEEEGWEHVSVSIQHRPPNWQEMCFVKDLFWDEEETVIQYHPPKSKYVNWHPYCLHLWRSKRHVFPMPPTIFVGPKK